MVFVPFDRIVSMDDGADGKEVVRMNKGMGYIQVVLDFILKLISFFKKDEDKTSGTNA